MLEKATEKIIEKKWTLTKTIKKKYWEKANTDKIN